MSRFLVSLLVLTLVNPASWAAPRVKDPPKPPVYFPTARGSKWLYDQEGAEQYHEVTDVQTKGGETVVTVARDKRHTSLSTYLVTDKGVFQRLADGFEFDPPLRRLNLPLRGGDAWEAKEPDLPGLFSHAGTMRVGEEERVTGLAGTYHAVRVDWEVTAENGRPLGTPKVFTFWYAKDVGLVQFKSPSTYRQLKSFTPAPAAKK